MGGGAGGRNTDSVPLQPKNGREEDTPQGVMRVNLLILFMRLKSWREHGYLCDTTVMARSDSLRAGLGRQMNGFPYNSFIPGVAGLVLYIFEKSGRIK